MTAASYLPGMSFSLTNEAELCCSISCPVESAVSVAKIRLRSETCVIQ